MSGRHFFLILFILALAVLAVGLVLCRPMEADSYAPGGFSMEAVDGAYVWAYEEQGDGVPVTVLSLEGGQELKDILSRFDGRGFGRTPASLFSDEAPSSFVGDRCWGVTLRCSVSGASLTFTFRGGALTISGGEQPATVLTQNKSTWASSIYDYILSLYPEPDPEPDPETPEEAE